MTFDHPKGQPWKGWMWFNRLLMRELVRSRSNTNPVPSQKNINGRSNSKLDLKCQCQSREQTHRSLIWDVPNLFSWRCWIYLQQLRSVGFHWMYVHQTFLLCLLFVHLVLILLSPISLWDLVQMQKNLTTLLSNLLLTPKFMLVWFRAPPESLGRQTPSTSIAFWGLNSTWTRSTLVPWVLASSTPGEGAKVGKVRPQKKSDL